MLADIDVFILPYAAVNGNSLLELLIRQFGNGDWTSFRAAIAFCKQSGSDIQGLLDAMERFAEGGNEIEITFGADAFGGETKGSDYDALEKILTKFNDYPNIKIFLYHEKGRTFHPKIYLFSNKEKQQALLIVGSSNWSKGGWVDNIEVNIGVKLNLKEYDHFACYKKMIEHINDYWHEYQGKGDMKAGQGWARLVTLESLDNFAPLLQRVTGTIGEEKQGQLREETEIDPELKVAEELFSGLPITLPHQTGINLKNTKHKPDELREIRLRIIEDWARKKGIYKQGAGGQNFQVLGNSGKCLFLFYYAEFLPGGIQVSFYHKSNFPKGISDFVSKLAKYNLDLDDTKHGVYIKLKKKIQELAPKEFDNLLKILNNYCG